jgi:hypothetical protein
VFETIQGVARLESRLRVIALQHNDLCRTGAHVERSSWQRQITERHGGTFHLKLPRWSDPNPE